MFSTVSQITLSDTSYRFSENQRNIHIPVQRSGPDLSHTSMVWCSTRLSNPPSATPGSDYVPSSQLVTFAPNEKEKICQLTILDDEFDPKLEGNETFEVFLSASLGGSLAEPMSATITVFDDDLDIPQMTFAHKSYIVDEKNGTLNATVLRGGDVSGVSSVLCYTRQKTAKVVKDYVERIKGNNSLLTFLPGERSKPCIVQIVDDEYFEPDEIFLLKLGVPEGSQTNDVKLGSPHKTTVTVTNHDDVPRIQFSQSAYSIHEPSIGDQIATIAVQVMRTGAANETASVRCSTRDGSAQSGLDYSAKSLILEFMPGECNNSYTYLY